MTLLDPALPTIGIVTPNAGGAIQPEADEIFRGRVNRIARGIGVERLSLDGYREALGRMPAALDSLVADGAEALVLNGTSLSFAFGREAHDRMVSTIAEQYQRPVTTMAASLVDALKSLGASKVVVATAYDAHVSGLLCDYLETHGLTARLGAFLNIVENARLRSLNADDIVELVQRAAARGSWDAIVVSCGNLRTLPLTAMLEEELRKPVISSALVGVWGALRLVGADTHIGGAGRLFASECEMGIKRNM